jgi:transcriptional regulator with XRE-family HTH domain
MPESIDNLLRTRTVGGRLRWLREFKDLTLKQFAGRVGCDAGYLSKLETGTAKNPSDRFLNAVRSEFGVRPDWLWNGAGDPFFEGADDGKGKPSEKWLADRVERVYQVLSDLPDALAVNEVLGRVLRDMPRNTVFDLWTEIEKLPHLPLTAQFFWQKAFLRIFEKRIAAEQSSKAKTTLDTVHATVNSDDVKAQWPLLKKRLKAATAVAGSKTQLAEFVGVKLASVSQWLSDSESQREPGAETTLRLLQWVEQQERQGK